MREAKIGVIPYSDGSGFRVEVRAYIHNDVPVISIEDFYLVEAKHWPEVRTAIETALDLVTPPAKSSLEDLIGELEMEATTIDQPGEHRNSPVADVLRRAAVELRTVVTTRTEVRSALSQVGNIAYNMSQQSFQPDEAREQFTRIRGLADEAKAKC